MDLRPMPHYFIVKIEIEKQKERKEKIGSFYLHHSEVQMQRNMQHGEIVAIGSIAAAQFKEPKVGQILIFHHFVEGEKDDNNFLFAKDGFNYYNVTAGEFNGHRCEAYGAWDGEKIIPHPEFVFLEKPKPEESEVDLKELSEEIGVAPNLPMTVSEGGLLLFTDWKETREEKEAKATRLMNEVKHASKGKNLSDSVKRGLEEKQREGEKITASLTAKRYEPCKVAFAPPSLDLGEGDETYALNIAANTELEFMDKTYIILQAKYFVALGVSVHKNILSSSDFV